MVPFVTELRERKVFIKGIPDRALKWPPNILCNIITEVLLFEKATICEFLQVLSEFVALYNTISVSCIATAGIW